MSQGIVDGKQPEKHINSKYAQHRKDDFVFEDIVVHFIARIETLRNEEPRQAKHRANYTNSTKSGHRKDLNRLRS